MTELIEGLTKNQRRAVETTRPRVVCIAGAGAGKTSVLSRRVARLLFEGVPAQYILCLTFTRKAAAEMRDRIAKLVEQVIPHAQHRRRRLPEIRTLHSWGAELLRVHAEAVGRTRAFTIYDEVDAEDVIRDVAKAMAVPNAEKCRLSTLQKRPDVLRAFAQRLQESNALTFDQIESLTLELLERDPAAQEAWTGRYRHILVDEYQDTNIAQVAIVKNLSPPNLFIVGDARQSIYRFRGAEVATIVEHARDRDWEVVELAENFRSVSEVVEVANTLVDGPWAPMVATRETPRESWSMYHRAAAIVGDEVGQVVKAALQLHEHGMSWHDMAVLSRRWRSLEPIREALADAQIPFVFYGSEYDPWSTPDGRNVARAVQLAANLADDNLVAMLANWGCVGRAPRVADVRPLRIGATRARATLFDHLADIDAQWGALRDRLRGENGQAAPIGTRQILDAFLDALRVRHTYAAAALHSRNRAIDDCVEQLTGELADEDFGAWWASRTEQERGKQRCRPCDGRGEVAPDGDVVKPCDGCEGTGVARGVHLMTVHGAKGLEWSFVAVIDVRAGTYPSDTDDAEEREEDLRVLYVGATRARDYLLLTCPARFSQPWQAGSSYEARPSPFLARTGLQIHRR